jgi:hypothetical protein
MLCRFGTAYYSLLKGNYLDITRRLAKSGSANFGSRYEAITSQPLRRTSLY